MPNAHPTQRMQVQAHVPQLIDSTCKAKEQRPKPLSIMVAPWTIVIYERGGGIGSDTALCVRNVDMTGQPGN